MTAKPVIPPEAFPAFDDTAAYVDGRLSRSEAMTLARSECWTIRDDFARSDLHVVRVYMRPVVGEEAQEFFSGEFEKGWVECPQTIRGSFPMWKVEPR